jgi:hypothetical protein
VGIVYKYCEHWRNTLTCDPIAPRVQSRDSTELHREIRKLSEQINAEQFHEMESDELSTTTIKNDQP